MSSLADNRIPIDEEQDEENSPPHLPTTPVCETQTQATVLEQELSFFPNTSIKLCLKYK